MRIDAAHKLEFRNRDTRERVEREVMRRILDAEDGAKERNEWLRELNDAVEGVSRSGSDLPWRDACELDDPLTMDAMLTVHGNYTQIIERDPKATVEAVYPEDERSAEDQEPFITAKLHQADADKHLLDTAWNCERYPVGIMYRGWKETFREERYVEYRERGSEEDAETVPEEQTDPTKEYEEVGYTRQVPAHSGLDLRAVDTQDFYLYPPDAKDHQTCWGCGEKVWMSADDLLNGIEDFEFDEEGVFELLKLGPDGYTNEKQEQLNTYAGVEGPIIASDGNYECFLWFGKLPPLMDEDGNFEIDREYLGKDVMFFCAPRHNIMLRMSFSPYGRKRPYNKFYFVKRPDSFYGYCLPQILNALQCEANANLRHTINLIIPSVRKPKS